MNIVESYNLFKQLLDEVATTRIDIQEFINLYKLAESDIIENRIDPIKNPRSKNIYLQSVQRVREELKTLVKEATVKTITNNIWSYPSNYKHYLLFQLNIDNEIKTARPITFDWLGANFENPHTSPNDNRVKFIEKSTGIEFYRGTGNYITTNSRFEYIAEQIKVYWDEIALTGNQTFVVGQEIYIVSGPDIIYNTITYKAGDVFTIITGLTTVNLGTTIVNKIQSTELSKYLHNEIVRKSIEIQMSIMDDRARKQSINFDEINS